MKPISLISALAVAASSVGSVPGFAAPMGPGSAFDIPSMGTLIDCHDDSRDSEQETYLQIPEFGFAKLMLADCEDTTGDTKPVTPSETNEVTRSIESVNDRCDDAPLRLRIDCIAQRYEILAQSPDLTGEYSEVQEALQSAAKKLRTLAQESADAGAARERLTVERNGKAVPVGRPLTPTSPAKQEAAFTAAIQIIEETETLLLRSAGTSKRRQVSYQRIAQAMDSNKVLLRS